MPDPGAPAISAVAELAKPRARVATAKMQDHLDDRARPKPKPKAPAASKPKPVAAADLEGGEHTAAGASRAASFAAVGERSNSARAVKSAQPRRPGRKASSALDPGMGSGEQAASLPPLSGDGAAESQADAGQGSAGFELMLAEGAARGIAADEREAQPPEVFSHSPHFHAACPDLPRGA